MVYLGKIMERISTEEGSSEDSSKLGIGQVTNKRINMTPLIQTLSFKSFTEKKAKSGVHRSADGNAKETCPNAIGT